LSQESTLHRERTALSISKNPFIIADAKIVVEGTNAYGAKRDGGMTDFIGPITVQLCKSNSIIPQKEGEGTPGTTEESYYLLAEYTTTVPTGLRFVYTNDKKFITEKTEKVIAGGEHVYSRVPLKELNND